MVLGQGGVDLRDGGVDVAHIRHVVVGRRLHRTWGRRVFSLDASRLVVLRVVRVVHLYAVRVVRLYAVPDVRADVAVAVLRGAQLGSPRRRGGLLGCVGLGHVAQAGLDLVEEVRAQVRADVAVVAVLRGGRLGSLGRGGLGHVAQPSLRGARRPRLELAEEPLGGARGLRLRAGRVLRRAGRGRRVHRAGGRRAAGRRRRAGLRRGRGVEPTEQHTRAGLFHGHLGPSHLEARPHLAPQTGADVAAGGSRGSPSLSQP
mmetsp:Transcript_15069/g.45178  ORF Transcript_15069/g.45178 Transcript_15069/m.45178 type:complete len:259 (+) Transcript_15069:2991-3767(+)